MKNHTKKSYQKCIEDMNMNLAQPSNSVQTIVRILLTYKTKYKIIW